MIDPLGGCAEDPRATTSMLRNVDGGPLGGANGDSDIGMSIQVRVRGRFFTREWHPYPTRIETDTGRVFFPPASNPTGTRCFTTAIILDCEQVKMCSFCYINYDLF
jgi:hypothetical protein